MTRLADRIAATTPEHRFAVAIDAAPAAQPHELAAALIDPLRTRGRHAQHLRADDFLRPASLRLEPGRTNPDAYYEHWLDLAALRREVLDPLRPGGTGRILPSLWDPDRDRATRAGYIDLPVRAVVLLSGALLLGAGLRFDYVVHIHLSPAALTRRTPTEAHWTLPAFARYSAEVDPRHLADVVILADHPDRPAILERSG